MKTRLSALALPIVLAAGTLAQNGSTATQPAHAPANVSTPQGTVRSAPENENPLVKLYDLSALGASLTPAGGPPGRAETQLIGALSNAFSLQVSPIGASMFLVTAMPEEHDKIAAILLQIRESTTERFTVELVTLSLPSDKAPPVGTTLKYASGTGTRIDHVVQQRTAAAFESLRSQTYIAEWQPVVGNESVGYQPLSKPVTSGVETRIFVGGADAQGVDIRIEGQISQAEITHAELPLAQGGAKLTIGLPQRDQRSVSADAHLRFGEPTVVSVCTGFDSASVLVTILKVERAK